MSVGCGVFDEVCDGGVVYVAYVLCVAWVMCEGCELSVICVEGVEHMLVLCVIGWGVGGMCICWVLSWECVWGDIVLCYNTIYKLK